MNDIAVAFAKLAGVRKAVDIVLAPVKEHFRERLVTSFSPREVGGYFTTAIAQLTLLRERLPSLYGDFGLINHEPELKMIEGASEPYTYGRPQLMLLLRTIDQAFEIRANSELAAPDASPGRPLVFLSHGRAQDWREVQAYIERDAGLHTLELAQEPNLGRTVIEKLDEETKRCTSAVIVMTGDDRDADGSARARENVIHEIGFVQARFGRRGVVLLHEEGVNVPSNIHGVVYVPFPKGSVSAAFGVLRRELEALYPR